MRLIFKFKLLVFLSFFLLGSVVSDEKESTYVIDFKEIPAAEFIRFVNRISQEHFLFNCDDLDFKITLIPEKPLTEKKIVDFLCEQLRVHGFSIIKTSSDFFAITRAPLEKEEGSAFLGKTPFINVAAPKSCIVEKTESRSGVVKAKLGGLNYKVQHRKVEDIEGVIKELVADTSKIPKDLDCHLETLRSLQIIKSTNTVIGSGPPESVEAVIDFLQSIDAPLKQVVVEVLAIEVDAGKSSDFGVDWSAHVRNKNFDGEIDIGSFLSKSSSATDSSDNSSSVDLVQNILHKGIGISTKLIGDVLFYKEKTFASLASLMSALIEDSKTSVVLYHLLTGSDHQKASFFAGENVPFVGSIIRNKGSSEQIVSNIEHQDVGIQLIITPYVGENNFVRVAIEEHITALVPINKAYMPYKFGLSGMQTTKNSLNTSVYVPDNCFCILSGTSRSSTHYEKTGIPCLGGIPWFSGLFGNTKNHGAKKNFVLFLRPIIVEDIEGFRKIIDSQEKELRMNAPEGSLDKVLDLIREN
jgi:type II secretory pathway component GspD/PulD (secretin)